MMMTRIWGATGLGLATVLALAGCSTFGALTKSDSSANAKPASVGPLPSLAPDANDPYNAYLADDLLAINSAKVELEYKCYAAHGYPQFMDVLPAQKANAFRGLAETPDFKTTFESIGMAPWYPTEEYARVAGVGHDAPGLDTHVSIDDASFRPVAEKCESSVFRTIGGSYDAVRTYMTLGNTLVQAIAVSEREMRGRLTQEVFSCMSRGKYPVDHHGPNEAPLWGVDFGVPLGTMPTMGALPDLTKGGRVQVVAAVPAGKYVPTIAESDAAAAMHRCSVESGAQDAWRRGMNEAKTKALAENEVALSELNPKIKALAKSAALALQNQPSILK